MKQDKLKQQNISKAANKQSLPATVSGTESRKKAVSVIRKIGIAYAAIKLVTGVCVSILFIAGIFGLVYVLQHGLVAIISSVLGGGS